MILSDRESVAGLDEGIHQADNGEFATDDDMRALHARFGTAPPKHLA